jgi:hypothetical protein
MDLETQRLANLAEKQKLLEELNLNHHPSHARVKAGQKPSQSSTVKRRKLNDDTTSAQPRLPSRTSARISASGTRVSYNEEKHFGDERPEPNKGRRSKPRLLSVSRRGLTSGAPPAEDEDSERPQTKTLVSSLPRDLRGLIQHYNSWTPSAPAPMLDPQTNTYHFATHPHFKPNKSPLSILLEGAFGGSYFSPWHSRTLGITLENDHLTTLPDSWLSQLQPPEKYITSATYDPELNKHGVQCGQTFSQWEDAGWMDFQHDPRGWFEWYIRFWLGRRLDDGEDERQVGRWARCVGNKGRWKRMLLKKYVEAGVRSVFDDDDGDEETLVSPVMHQTCLHWAYQVTQEDLDEAWRERRG